MSESREEKTPSAIMLFGKTISLLSSSVLASHQQEKLEQSQVLANDDDHHLQPYFGDHNTETSLRGDGSSRKVNEQEEEREAIDKNHSGTIFNDNSIDLAISSNISDNPKTPSVEREASSLKMAKDGEAEQADHHTSSSSQEKPLKKPDKILPCPRCNSMDTKFCYFNNYNVNQPRHFCRSCQRYWTAGGTMRNVPVGAGRRKNKYSASASASSHYGQMMIPFAGNNIRHFTFGSDSPLSDTTASAISWDDRSSGSPVTDNRGKVNSAPGLTYPWNSPTPPPALSPSGFPVQLPPATSNWACNVPGQYRNPMNLSPTFLGKHSRDGYIISPSTTPGSNNDRTGSRECGIFQGFRWKGGDDRNYYVADTSATVLEANPAAYSRSVNFRENSS